MLELFIYTIIYIMAHAISIFFFLKMIGHGQLLDIILKWQKFLDFTYNHKSIVVQFIGKALGNCEMCTCFWSSFVSFFIYRSLATHLGIGIINGWLGLAWLWVFWGMCAFYTYWFITKTSDNGL